VSNPKAGSCPAARPTRPAPAGRAARRKPGGPADPAKPGLARQNPDFGPDLRPAFACSETRLIRLLSICSAMRQRLDVARSSHGGASAYQLGLDVPTRMAAERFLRRSQYFFCVVAITFFRHHIFFFFPNIFGTGYKRGCVCVLVVLCVSADTTTGESAGRAG